MKAPFSVMNLPEKIPYMANKLETTTKAYISDNHIDLSILNNINFVILPKFTTESTVLRKYFFKAQNSKGKIHTGH